MATRYLVRCFIVSILLGFTAPGLVKKTLRHRRQVPLEQNVTSTRANSQPVVFNHVYNINVPAGHLCSVDVDTPENAAPTDSAVDSGTHLSTDGETQIVFTHRINIPRGACGCDADQLRVQDLLNRIEALEGEVLALRSRSGGEEGACCSAQAARDVTLCGVHGKYSLETCGCTCEEGWKGTNCTEPDCPENCRDRGLCKDGECICEDPWTGWDCTQLLCPKDCLGHGLCVNGTCQCEPGFSGEDCGLPICPGDCHGNGLCVDGICACAAGYAGEDCSRLTCLYDCNGRGACFNGMCVCDAGYQGDDCSQLACPNDCQGRGQCVNGWCACDAGFRGNDCSEVSCPNDCLQRGRCVNGQCVCQEGFAGEDCSIKVCPSNCYGRGECIEGLCACHAGFTGADCALLSCPRNCLERGRCLDGQCVCNEGFAGEDCGRKACLNDCLGRGHCDDGSCICQEGYAGPDCSRLTCPDKCNNRGRCFKGRCECESGYEGETCAEQSCPNRCHERGNCVEGRCVCDEGYITDDCSEVSPATNLTLGEVTTETVDLSWRNEMLVTEYLITYLPTQPSGTPLDFTVSGDRTSATIQGLEPGLEYMINVYAVLNDKRSVPVSGKAATALPRPQGLRFKSVKENSVEVAWEQPNIPFDGWEIYFRNTKEENGKVVNTVPASKKHFLQLGLGPGQLYEVSLRMIKNNTMGPPVIEQVTTNIDAPRQLQVLDVSDSSALISWSEPVAQAERVTLVYKPSKASSEGARVEIFPPDKQHSLEGLKPDTEYTVTLVSRIHNFSSEPANATFTTALDAPRELLATLQTENSITLKWRNSQAQVDHYRVKYSPLSGAAHGEEVFPRGLGETTTATITGLRPGTEYGIGVTGMKNERESLPAIINSATDLDPPQGLEQTESTATSIGIRWKKPKARVSRYRLVYVSRDGQVEESEIPGSETTFVLTDLTPATSYSVTMTAERGHKMSSPVTLAATTGLTTPKGLRFSDITDSTAVVRWSTPQSAVDNYHITYMPFEGGSPMSVTVDGDVLEAVLSNMSPGKMYQVTVRAIKGLEESDPSGDVLTTALDRPQGLTALNITDSSALLQWQPPLAAVEDYVVSYSSESVSPISKRISGTELTMASLLPGTRYTVQLFASKGEQMSAAALTEFTTKVDPPRDLAAVNIQPDAATLTWRHPQVAVSGYSLTFSAADGSTREVMLSPTASSYNMVQLSRSTEYSVQLQAIVGTEKSQPITTVFSTVGHLHKFPKDCAQIFLNGENISGIYTIYVAGVESQVLQVYCDMETDDGGWLVFLRRQNGGLEFFRNWKNYTAGFGNVNDEFWLGLANLHKITTAGQYVLRVDLRDAGDSAYAQYDKFFIAEPRTRFKIHIGAYSGTAGDSMTYHQGRPFSTFDNDNDIAVTNCALSYKGAFWYKNCHRVNLMGKYGDKNHSKGVNWFHWKGHETSIQFAEMKLRPVDFGIAESRKKRS
ncbi:tenascin-like [Stigmatopora nigra]